MKGAFADPQDGLVLRDIHLPPNPAWWPPAPGWWVLFGIMFLALIVTLLLYRDARKKRLVRQRILAEIGLVAARHPDDDTAYAASLHQLLRRAARRYASDAHRSQGAQWRQVLARVPVDEATLDALMTLDERMYQPHARFDRPSVQAAMHRWLNASLRQMTVTETGHA
jgi:hypothetical protein